MKNMHGGGEKTTKNGLDFEKKTDLKSKLEKKGYIITKDGNCYKGDKLIGYLCQKHKLYSILPKDTSYDDIISKKLLPDEAFVNFLNKTIYIIEKKYQEANGSVDEKLQTCDFKLKQYKKIIDACPDIDNVEYIYILNDWFKDDKYKDSLQYIKESSCSYYFNEIPLDKLKLK